MTPSRPRRISCPICAKPAVHAFRPFCSQACADRDLQNWLAGAYRLPTEEDAPPPEPGSSDNLP